MKSGHNEAQLEDYQNIRVVYHETVIVTLDKINNKILLDNGGWNTQSTTRHIKKALDRLRHRFTWIPNVFVGHVNRKLVAKDPSGIITTTDTEGFCGRGGWQPNSMTSYWGYTR